MQIFRVLHAVPYSNQTAVKDVIANLHSYFTCNLLIALAVLLSYKQFGGRPIECMLPMTGSSFSGAWEQYAESYCWSEDTYYVSFGDVMETFSQDQLKERRISYYQWMPFFLIFQAACFKIPTFVWKYFSGMRVGEVLRLSTNESNSEPATRTSNINALCMHLQGALRFHDRLSRKRLTPHKVFRFLNLKYSSYYVTLIYLLSKVIFLGNVLVQTDLLNNYLVPNAADAFGYYTWRDLWTGNKTWEESGLFPRVTYCNFMVREMGQTQNFTVQCVLILNIFTEKAFIVLWLWYNVLSFITLCNVSSWVFSLLNPRSSEHFILNHLEMSGGSLFASESPKEIQVQVARFIDKYLKTDGIFILRLIAEHADVVFTTDLIAQLWESHYRIEKQREAMRITDQKWQDHLKRFEVIEAREAEAYEDAMTKLEEWGYFDGYSPASGAKPPRRGSSIVGSPPKYLKRYRSNEELNFGSPAKSVLDSDSDEESRHNSRRNSVSKANHK